MIIIKFQSRTKNSQNLIFRMMKSNHLIFGMMKYNLMYFLLFNLQMHSNIGTKTAPFSR